MADAVVDAATLARRGWRVRAVFAILTGAAVALFVTAGNWQHDRLRAKQALRDRFDAASRAPPIALPDPGAGFDWTTLRYRPVVATGRFDASRQIFIDNRTHAGRVGYEVIVPLALDDGRHVLVDRGWVAQGPTRAQLPQVAPPPGHVEVRGRIDIAPSGYFELSRAPPQGAVWQHVDPSRFTQATGVAVLPVVIEQTAPLLPQDDLVRDRPAPDFGIDQHRIYMVQWYSFAALAIALWVLLTLRASARGTGTPHG
jgi:cytochrome oxidase assembly protein ShyY1